MENSPRYYWVLDGFIKVAMKAAMKIAMKILRVKRIGIKGIQVCVWQEPVALACPARYL